ncbi:hypothetical protein E4U55_006210 [Claviceps digitariae]|nr:hypothetical protein E4U55_006210 [Claviceps digitariae]
MHFQAQTLLPTALLLAAVSAAKLGTVVDLGYSKYQGVSLANGITQWLGMRFAAPPVGELRFMPPRDVARTEGIQMADRHGKYCLGTGDSPTKDTTSEDCLFLDVQAPSDARPGSLPVFLFIQGGGFNHNSNANINASGLIQASGHGIVVVSFNYRVGPYGFLTDGQDLTPNNGLRDQEKAMQWVQQHIHKFGGNPGHVTLGGASAGAGSVAIHLTRASGNGTGTGTGTGTGGHGAYFHAVAGESPSFGTILTVEQSQYLYRDFATRLGCSGADSLSCLRGKTARELQAHNTAHLPLPGATGPPTYLYGPCLDGDFLPDYTYRLLSRGHFLKLPAIFGDDTNGGTVFAPRNASTLAESNSFMRNNYPFLTPELVRRMNTLYPNPDQDKCPSRGCYWRRASNTYQEARWTCPARTITTALAAAGSARSYAYLWNVEDPAQLKQGLGVPHTVELAALLGPDYAANPPESYRRNGTNYPASRAIQRYWTNFIKHYDPNHGGQRQEDASVGLAEWEAWSRDAPSRLVFQNGGKTEMEAFGEDLNTRCAFWQEFGVELRM